MRNDLKDGSPVSVGEVGSLENLRETRAQESRFEALALDLMNRKTKPPGSLGVLEKLAIRIAGLQRSVSPSLRRKRICVFAGSHGVCEENVSAYSAAVTSQMVLNFLGGGAAINVLARHGQIDLHIIDAGVATKWPEDLPRNPKFFVRPIRPGTSNFLLGSAMTSRECEQARAIGREQIRIATADQIELIGIGEMGIGNTTSAAALLAALCGLESHDVAGRGTGINDEMLERKAEVIRRAVKKHRSAEGGLPGFYWLAAVGGFEIAAMTGAILEAVQVRLPLVVDGFVATAAAAAAFSIDPRCRDVCFFSHRSEEQAHGRVLKLLNVEPMLDLKMRLGEGTGAALAMPIMDACAKVLCEMATFESAGVSDSRDDERQRP